MSSLLVRHSPRFVGVRKLQITTTRTSMCYLKRSINASLSQQWQQPKALGLRDAPAATTTTTPWLVSVRTLFQHRTTGRRAAASSWMDSATTSTGSSSSSSSSIASHKDGPALHDLTPHHFSTQAEMMHHLGISTNGQVRPSTRRQASPTPNGTDSAALINQSRRRRRRPIRRSLDPQQPMAALYPLKAMHIAQTIDLDQVRQTVLHENTEHRKLFGKNSLVVELENSSGDPRAPPQFVSVFRFGSVVFLNVPDKEANVLLDRIRALATDSMETERREHFGIMVQPPPQRPPPSTSSHAVNGSYHHVAGTDEEPNVFPPPPEQVVTGDYCVVPEIDLNGVAVISNILAQTVALDSYNDMVDRLLSQFATINSAVRASGQFQHSDKNYLFKTVAQNNAIFIDMIAKIRLKDRAETAWTMTKYETIHYGLKAEFEIDDRFDQIEFKLNLIQQNAKFFLEVLQHQKSNSLEWIIVWLIALESALMCVDMSGKGEALFQYLGLI